MDLAVQSGKDQRSECRKDRFVKAFTAAAVLLFFTGIAMMKVIGDRYRDSRDSLILDAVSGLGARSPGDPSSVPSSAAHVTPGSGAASASPEGIPVYIVGAVASPGIYRIDGPVYLFELIERAGGLTADADSTNVNLAFQVSGNVMIRIPFLHDAVSGPGGGYSPELIVTEWTPTAESADPVACRVNINTAGISGLTTLPGVGEATAKAIIDFRTGHGPFAEISDIMKVPGIKESKFSRIKDLITV